MHTEISCEVRGSHGEHSAINLVMRQRIVPQRFVRYIVRTLTELYRQCRPPAEQHRMEEADRSRKLLRDSYKGKSPQQRVHSRAIRVGIAKAGTIRPRVELEAKNGLGLLAKDGLSLGT